MSRDVVITRFLDRQQRTVLSAVGAGKPLSFFVFPRWDRELSDDLECSIDEAHTINVFIHDALKSALAADHSVTAARAVYGFVAATLTGVDPHGDLHLSGGTGQHTVYKLFDGDRRLLYVGITSRGPQRLVEHHRKKPWFPLVESVVFEKYETRSESAHREEDLIKRFHPIHNIMHNKCRVRGRSPKRALPQTENLAVH